MLLNMLYFKTYLTDSIARLKVLKLPLAIKSSAVRSRTSFWTKREFWRENCPCQFKHWKYPSYEANISICCSICSILKLIQRTASTEQKDVNYLWPCHLRAVVNVGTAMLGATAWKELWQESSPWHFKHGKYRCYEANISKLFSMIQYKWNCLCYLMTWYLENEGEVAFAIAIVDHRLFSTSSFSEGVRLADKSIRMEGALGSRLSMTFQTCQIPKLRGQYFDMLLNMFYLESYLKDGVARAKIVELPFRLDVFAVRSRTSVWRRREFWQEHFSWHFKHATYRSFGANISICCSIYYIS